MYTQFLNLSEAPFSTVADPRYVYVPLQHREVLEHLLYDIAAGDGGLSVLTGEAGAGKSTLCRLLLEQLPDNVDVVLFLSPFLDKTEFLASICDRLNVAYPSGSSLEVLSELLGKHLVAAYKRGRRTIVVIGEAQNLGFEVLEQIRLLTYLETRQIKLLQIILLGQPTLNRLLGHANLRQIAQRVTARYHLQPLNPAETRAYIQHRLAVSGCRRPLFTRLALTQVHKWSGGIPRIINVICDRALMGAYGIGKTRVSRATVRRAAREVMPQAYPSKFWKLTVLTVGLGFGLAMASLHWHDIQDLATFSFMNSRGETRSDSEPAKAGMQPSTASGRAAGQGPEADPKQPASASAADVSGDPLAPVRNALSFITNPGTSEGTDKPIAGLIPNAEEPAIAEQCVPMGEYEKLKDEVAFLKSQVGVLLK